MSGHPDTEMRERLAAYALGAMDRDGLRSFERELDAHLADGCADCEHALVEYSEAVVALAESAPAARPSEGLRDRVLAEISTPQAPARPMNFLRWAAVLILAVGGLGGWLKYFEARRALLEKDQDVVRLEERLDQVSRDLQESGRMHALMVASQQLEFVALQAAQEETRIPIARIAYDAGGSRAVALFDEATAPAGRDYQLWALAGDTVQSLGVIRADDSGRATIEATILAAADQLQGFAISLEAEGGSPNPAAPSGPVIAVGLRAET